MVAIYFTSTLSEFSLILFLYFSQRNGEVLFRNSNIFSCAKFCSFSIACCYLCQFFHGCVVWNRWTFTSITIYFGVCSSIFEEPCFHICSSLSISLLFQSLFAHNLQFSVHSLDHYSPLMAATSIRRKLVVRKWIMWREMQNKALLQVEMVQLLQIQRKSIPSWRTLSRTSTCRILGLCLSDYLPGWCIVEHHRYHFQSFEDLIPFSSLVYWPFAFGPFCCYWKMNAGAVMLTDCVFWFIIVPFLTIKDYNLNFVSA